MTRRTPSLYRLVVRRQSGRLAGYARFGALLCLSLLACSAPVPTVNLPVAPAALNGEELKLDTLLTPTEFGASSHLLCPWARGEVQPPASIARWVAEKRLVHRVIVVSENTMFGGAPIEDGGTLHVARVELGKRCGASLPTDVLLAAAVDTPAGLVVDAADQVARSGFDPAWLLVHGPTRPAPHIVGSDNATIVASEPAQAFLDRDPTSRTLAEIWAAKPGCVVLVAPAEATWGGAVAIADGIRSVAAHVLLARLVDDAPPKVPALSGALQPTSGAVAVLPLLSSKAYFGHRAGTCRVFAPLRTGPPAEDPSSNDRFTDDIFELDAKRSLDDALNGVGD